MPFLFKNLVENNLELIQKALENAQVKELFESINKITPISFEPSPDSSWSIAIVDGQFQIQFAQIGNPAAALAHELLHARMLINGYKSYLTAVSMDGLDDTLIAILEMLQNELQHHKFFSSFEDLGFSAAHFYEDDDVNSCVKTGRILNSLPSSRHAGHLLILFLTAIAPGGAGNDEKTKLRNDIARACSDIEWEMLRNIELEIENWKLSNTLDAGPTILRILRLLKVFNRTWIGTSQNFPIAGFFVDQSFTNRELMDFLNRRT
jgi:hypothetical protein